MSHAHATAGMRDDLVPLETLISLKGKTALITGGAAGIGKAIAHRLAEAGADLVLVDRSEQGLAGAKVELQAWGRAIETHVVDLGTKAAIDGLWELLADRPPDILVNNAGIYPDRLFEDVDEEHYRLVMAVNLDAVFWMCQGFIKKRGRKGGVIVNIGSIEAVMPFKDDMSVYSAGKSAVITLTRAIASEQAKHGFRANVVVPGGIDTPGTRGMAKGILKGRLGLLKVGYDFLQRLPARRRGQPDDIARVVLFLASDLSAFMHGSAVPVDGGFLSK